MTLVSRDQMPPRTPYEAELRERLATAEWQAGVYHRLAAAQDAVVKAARALSDEMSHGSHLAETQAALKGALDTLDREAGKIVLESMPPQIRDALTAQSALVEGLMAQEGPLFPGMSGAEPSAHTAVALDVEGFARDLDSAGPLEVEQLAGRGWPAGWASYTGISDQEIVWPVQPKGQPVPGGTPIAAFASYQEQQLYWRMRNAAPLLLELARAAAGRKDGE